MWGLENWGEMIWMGTVIGVPLTSPLGLVLLVTAFIGVVARIEIRWRLREFRDPRQAPIAKDSGIPRPVIRFKMLQAMVASASCDNG